MTNWIDLARKMVEYAMRLVGVRPAAPPPPAGPTGGWSDPEAENPDEE